MRVWEKEAKRINWGQAKSILGTINKATKKLLKYFGKTQFVGKEKLNLKFMYSCAKTNKSSLWVKLLSTSVSMVLLVLKQICLIFIY